MNKIEVEQQKTIKIDVELLISLIEARPVIWDNTLVIYKDREMRNNAWREISAMLKHDYGEIDKKQRFDFGRTVLKKWTHLRDSWCKDYRRRMRAKNKCAILKCRPYKYQKRMSFLRKIIETDGEEADEESLSSINIENQEMTDSAQKTNTEVVEIQTLNNNFEKQNVEEVLRHLELRKTNEDDPQFHFFKSLSPFTSTLSPDEMLSFQGDVIRLLQDIMKRRQNNITSKVESDSV